MMAARGRRAALTAGALALALAGCGDIQPDWRRDKAPAAPETGVVKFSDGLLTERLQSALVADSQIPLNQITASVYQGNGFLVGFVSGDAERARVVAAGQTAQGLLSLTPYLPQRVAGSTLSVSRSGEPDPAPPGSLAFLVRIAIQSALASGGASTAGTLEIHVLDGVAVLLGVLATDDALAIAPGAARSVEGIRDVRSFLVPPQHDYDQYIRRTVDAGGRGRGAAG